MTSRRLFLEQAAWIGAGLLIAPTDVFSKPKGRVGLQLYTLRNLISKDVRETLRRVSDIGFKEVETYGYSKEKGFWGLNIREFKKLLKSHGLKSPSGHYDFEPYLKDKNIDSLKYNIEAAEGVGQKYLTVPYLSPALRVNLDSYKSLAEKLNSASEMVKDAGLDLVYHNHDFEFIDFGGKSGFDILLSETKSQDLKLELDLYWIARAGKDPLDLFRANPGRFVMWHVKDMEQSDKSFAPVGSGIIDFASIFNQEAVSGMKHYFVEQDVIKGDPYEAITRSFNYLKRNLV